MPTALRGHALGAAEDMPTQSRGHGTRRPYGADSMKTFAHVQHQTRRHFLGAGSLGLGAAAYALLSGETAASTDPLAPRKPHFAPKAKRVIYLHMSGSPPHLDLFDYKPELVKRTGQDVPESFLKGRRFAFTSGVPKLLGTPRQDKQHGKGGVWMSDAVPKLHEVV